MIFFKNKLGCRGQIFYPAPKSSHCRVQKLYPCSEVTETKIVFGTFHLFVPSTIFVPCSVGWFTTHSGCRFYFDTARFSSRPAGYKWAIDRKRTIFKGYQKIFFIEIKISIGIPSRYFIEWKWFNDQRFVLHLRNDRLPSLTITLWGAISRG